MPFFGKDRIPIPTKDLISWMFDDPKYDIDKPIYVDASDPSRSISARQGKTLIRQLAAGLKKHGLQKGDCVVLALFNDIYFPILTLGTVAAGGVSAGCNPGYTPFEIAHHVNVIHGKFIICEPEALASVLKAKHDVPKERIFVFDVLGQPIPEGFKSWKTLLEHGETDWVRFDDHKTSTTTNALLQTSSGTTGLPKAVQISHSNLIAEHTVVFDHHPRPYEARRLIPLPLFHAGATPTGLIDPFRGGNTVYVMRRFDLEPFLEYHSKYQISEMLVVPPMAIAIIMSPLSKKHPMNTVQWGISGAAPMDRGVAARMKELISPGAPFTQVWGMTETSCIGSMLPPPEHDDTGSVGRLIANLDAKLVDDEGNDISAMDVRGELCVRGPTVTRGYYENPEANKRDFDVDGFFHTGDIAYLSSKTGFWYIVDRKKELIKVRAFQVAPPELEAILLSHPSIIDAAVIGIPHPSSGEVPRAYVVVRPGSSLSEQDVMEYTEERLAKYKRLEGGVRFVEAVPKTASGKILKRVLREMAEGEGRRGQGAKL